MTNHQPPTPDDGDPTHDINPTVVETRREILSLLAGKGLGSFLNPDAANDVEHYLADVVAALDMVLRAVATEALELVQEAELATINTKVTGALMRGLLGAPDDGMPHDPDDDEIRPMLTRVHDLAGEVRRAALRS
jgi:hypothetical protein